MQIADPYYKMTHSPKHVTKCQEKISRGMKSLEKILGDNQFFAGKIVLNLHSVHDVLCLLEVC